ncbi:type II secretion system F family protein [Maricaulis sp.]|uniref:type II secretion system F family protein n=1 Tax=Maricaulis sp. TaxID=1486257 RepID=UPI001B170772|nr:type II secretion system F family protein [Maricaulis sp.]MBO6797776.1 type II secretion system F family protein [Maricaulis sp.]
MADVRVWHYLGENAQGQMCQGCVDARSSDHATRILAARGIVAVEVSEEKSGQGQHEKHKLSAAMLADFAEAMADLLGSALSVTDALLAFEISERRPRLKAFASRLVHAVRNGRTLNMAMQEDISRPPRILIAMTAAGEESGALAASFSDLAQRLKRGLELRRGLIGQMVYPIALVGLMFLTLVFLAFLVLPNFEQVFEGAAAPPPPETAFVLSAGAFLRNYAVWIPVFVLGVVVLVQRFLLMAPEHWARQFRKVPVVGRNIWLLNVASYARTLGVLLSAGLPLLRAEAVARDTVGDPAMRQQLSGLSDRIRGGVPLSAAFSESRALPEDLVRQVQLGEETGQLDTFLLRAAGRYEREAELALNRSVELLGPVLIVCLGVCVAGVIVSVISGVLSLNDAIY